jgi:hypothetical protein
VKTKVFDLGGGLIEFMAIGPAVKKMPGAKTRSENLIPQAIIQDRDTYVDSSDNVGSTTTDAGKGSTSASARRLQGGPMSIIVFLFIVAFYILKIFFLRN